MNIETLLSELKRLFPNQLPRVTAKSPFDADQVNRAIGAQEVIRAIEAQLIMMKT